MDKITIIGKSLPLQEVQAEIMQLAKSTIPVLILGETGTGKELIARATGFQQVAAAVTAPG